MTGKDNPTRIKLSANRREALLAGLKRLHFTEFDEDLSVQINYEGVAVEFFGVYRHNIQKLANAIDLRKRQRLINNYFAYCE